MDFTDPLFIAKLLVCGFFCVLFLQSGIDKVTDRAGNLEWMKPHFAGSPFKNSVPLLLGVITLIELSAGVLSGVGIVGLLTGNGGWGVFGLGASCFALLCLFAGQRLAKDYAGAAVLAAYFAVGLIGLYLFSVP